MLPAILGLVLGLPAALQDAALERIQSVAEAIDLPDPVARRRAAVELAGRTKTSVEDWLECVGRVLPSDRQSFICGEPQASEPRLYVPRTWKRERAAPLLVAFHGTGGSGEDVEPMWRGIAEELGMLVLAPSESGRNEGYTYSPRERGEALAAVRWMRRNVEVDTDRVYATGISRGGHLAWDLALRHPDLFAAIAPMIGGPRFQLDHGQNNLRYLENVVSLPIRDLQGAQDDPALVANVRTAFKRLDKLGARDAKFFEFPELGHSFDFSAVDWKAFFGSAKRDPIPDRVVLLASKVEGARAYWVEITKLAKEVSEDVVPTVTASTWKGLDESGRRDFLEAEVEKRTARLEVKMSGPNRFTATGDRVLGFRLLLAKSMFDPAKPIQVLFGGKLVEKKVVPDAKVLLGEFVERFDKSFLPIASVDVP